MPRLALTVRLKTSWKKLKTSVVAPPMSTPMTWIFSRCAIVWIISPTAAGVGLIGFGAVHAISFVVARRVRHHVLHELVVDLVPRRHQVLPLQDGADVVGDHQRRLVAQGAP